MIREKAIFIKLNQINFSDQQLFDTATSDFVPSTCTCPRCKSVDRFREIQPYRRDLISVENQKRIESNLSVRRFLCDSCGHTHALLPDALIPYGSYSLRFILTILQAYLNRTCTVADLCQYWDIAISTLYEWIHLFIDQYNAWCAILDRILWVNHGAIHSILSTYAFPGDFMSRFGFSFLQNPKTSLSDRSPLGDRRRKAPST